jgi:hypothetical protein
MKVHYSTITLMSLFTKFTWLINLSYIRLHFKYMYKILHVKSFSYIRLHFKYMCKILHVESFSYIRLHFKYMYNILQVNSSVISDHTKYVYKSLHCFDICNHNVSCVWQIHHIIHKLDYDLCQLLNKVWTASVA